MSKNLIKQQSINGLMALKSSVCKILLPRVKFLLYCEKCAFLRLKVYTFTYSEGMGRERNRGYIPRPIKPHIRFLICHISNFLINFLIPFHISLSHVTIVLTVSNPISYPLSKTLSDVVIYNIVMLNTRYLFT